MAEEKRKFIGLSQYKAPFSYELAGKHFHLIMDDGSEYSYYFVDGETVQYAKKGEAYIFENYECLKGDDTTYFVHIQPSAGKGLINCSLILDTEQRLVTFVLMEEGFDPEYPGLIRTTPYFGAIKVPGRDLPKIRHHLTDRMVGKHIAWRYHPGIAIQHIYKAANCVRADLPGKDSQETMRKMIENGIDSPDPEVRAAAEKRIADQKERNKYYPFYEEPSFHIWISDRLNLFCFVEEIMMKYIPGRSEGGGGILLLQDIDRIVDVGLCFSKGQYYMATAFGEENEEPDELDTKETIYDWENLESMPSIRWEIPKEE